MSEKSVARLEMELQELQDQRAKIGKPESSAWGVVLLLVGIVMFWISDGIGLLFGVILALAGIIGMISAVVSRGTHQRKLAAADEAIKQKRLEIVEAKEKLV